MRFLLKPFSIGCDRHRLFGHRFEPAGRYRLTLWQVGRSRTIGRSQTEYRQWSNTPGRNEPELTFC